MAINTSRAPRRTDIPSIGQTNEHVAPGTYSNTHNEPSTAALEAPIPFNSMQQRNLNQNLTTSAITPGPGAYLGTKGPSRDGKKDYGEDAAGVGPISLRSKSARLGPVAPGSSVYMPSTIEKNPGPGTYPNAAHQDLGKVRRKDLQGPMRPVLEVMERTTPSIPVMRLLPGQQPETEAGDNDVANLMMRHTGDHGDTAGPGEYDPRGEQIICRTTPQVVFHASTLSRRLWEPSPAIDNKLPSRDNPGPGSYEPVTTKAKGTDEDTQPTFQFASRSLMAHQHEVSVERVVPGPGQYEMLGDIDRSVKSARDRSTVRGELTQFGATSERSSTLHRPGHQPYKDPFYVHNVPGPGHYQPAWSSFPADPKTKEAEEAMPDSYRKKIHGVHHPTIVMALAEAQGPLQAFNTTDDRPCNRSPEQRTPAPWQYNKETARGHSMNAELREKAKVGRRGAFGTCAERFYGSPLAGRRGLPDPSTDGSEGIHGTSNSEPRSMFQSASPRFRSAPGPREVNATKVGNTDTPAPGAYVVEKEPSYRSPFRHPRQDHLSFGSGKTRFDVTKTSEDLFYGHVKGASNPGPGNYEPKLSRDRVSGIAPSKAARPPNLVGNTSEEVGPGKYSNMDTHMLKKTFNVSTQAPVNDGSVMHAKRPITGKAL